MGWEDINITLMMESAQTSETSVYSHQYKRRYNPEDSHLTSTRLQGATSKKLLSA
jgi:hypothetical protein